MSAVDLVDYLLSVISNNRRRIVVIGDTMTDRWVDGYLDLCQDNCPKFVHGRTVEVPGGAANAARSIACWEANVSLFGYAENDCPIKTRYVDITNGRTVMRYDDDGPATRAANYGWAQRAALEMVTGSRNLGAVLLSDYDKGFLTPEIIRDVVVACKARGIPCVADCKREPELYAGCILKCNADWYSRHGASSWPDMSADIVCTYGADPPTINRVIVPYNLATVECRNHVGAGDCFAAHLTLALAYGFSLKDAAVLAHSAGRVYVQHRHNRQPRPNEIRTHLATATLVEV